LFDLTPAQERHLSKILYIRITSNLSTTPSQTNEIINSLKREKYKFFYNDYGIESGYLLWANVNSFGYRRFIEHKIKPIYLHEWNEGTNNIFLQLVINKPFSKITYAQLLKERRQFNLSAYISKKDNVVNIKSQSSFSMKEYRL
jgi:hemolysin-activating ACP:hemolysin acyltransferase